DVEKHYAATLFQASLTSKGMRIKLRLEAKELCSLPWEYLYDAQKREYLCLSNRTPIVRYLDVPREMPPFSISKPLNILIGVALSCADDLLDIDQEVHRISHALSDLSSSGSVRVTVAKHLDLSFLQELLRKEEFHVFHFIGHGTSKTESNEGILV